MAPLPAGPLVVVTGITGYIASHTGLAALKAGYRVRGTVRSLSKAEELRKAYEKEGVDTSKLEFVTLDDLFSSEQFEKAFKSADGVIHLALPEPALTADYVQLCIDGTLVPLKAANKAGVKQFVLTGTSMSVISPGALPEKVVGEGDWNEAIMSQWKGATEAEKQHPLWFFTLYGVGKQMGEKAAWKYVDEEKPSFEFSVILPDVNWGPVLFGKEALTPGWINGLLRGDGSALGMPAQWYVDVRDTGRLHVLALSDKSLIGKRIWAAGGPFGWNEVLAILRKNFPAYEDNIPADIAKSALEPCPWKIDNASGTKALGGWIGLEKSVVDNAKSVGL